MSAPPRKISLVLGSGGARGLAHIGVIHALERHGWQIGAMAGSSMGALIGGFYAAGKLDDYAEWALDLTEFNVLRYLDIAWGGAGMLKGQLLMEQLRHFVGERRIEDLPLPLTIVASDVLARKEVWLRRGDLSDAIRASIAVPTVFSPHVIDGRPLLDGGILNPVPIAPTLHDRTEAIIAVSLSGVPQKIGSHSRRHAPAAQKVEKPRNRYRKRIEAFIDQLQERLGLEDEKDREELSITDAAILSLDAVQAAVARCMLAAYPPDLLIEIPINTCGAHEFYRAREVIEVGETIAEREIERFTERED
jgi:NTE family protein